MWFWKNAQKVLLTMVFGGLASAAVAQENRWTEIRFGVEADVPPFESRNAKGELIGLNIELGNALCAELAARCVWVDQPYATNIAALEAGRFDAIMPMTATPLRQEKIDFTDNLYPLASALVARKSVGQLSTVQSLKGKRVGVLAGTSREAYAKAKWAPEGVIVQSFALNGELISSLQAGEIDATLQDTLEISTAFLQTLTGADFGFAGEEIKDEMLGSGVAIGVRKADPDLRDALNVAMQRLKQKGQYQTILQRYLPSSGHSGGLTFHPGEAGQAFSQAVQVGSTLYLSGILGVGADDKLASGGIRGEMTQAMNTLRNTLEHHGSSLDQVAKCTVILADIKDFSTMNAVYTGYFSPGRLPARTTFAGKQLVLNAHVEIDCVAVVKA